MIFFDAQNNTQAISGLSITENVATTLQLSGVYFYTLGSSFSVAISDLDWLNDASFPSAIVTVDGSEYGLPTLNLTGSDLLAWSNAWDNINSSYLNNTWAITATNICSVSNTANITAMVLDWIAGSSVSSPNASICLSTYAANQTRIYEDFRTETRRRASTWAAWDSSQDLTTYDGNQGLQVVCSRLIYPGIDYGTYNPLPASQPDYSACAGTRWYYTNFYHNGTSHSNGLFTFGDYNINEADITANDFKMEISLDGVAWYNMNAAYLGGALIDGSGCRINSGVNSLTLNNSWQFTLGTGGFTDGSTGLAADGFWGIFLRISWTAAIAAKYLGSITLGDWV